MTLRTLAVVALMFALLMFASMFVGCAHPSQQTLTAPATVRAASTPSARKAPTQAEAIYGPFEVEIQTFEAADRSPTPPPKDAVVFYGSSSFRIWTTLAADMPGVAIVNRGFGGSNVPDCVRYFDRAVVPLRPRVIVLYAGDNDLAAGHTPALVFADTEELFGRIVTRFPNARVIYVSVKPSPARAKLLPQVAEVNTGVRVLVDRLNSQGNRFTFVDVATPMLGPDGQPRGELFGPDRLHMNAQGYALWTSILRPVVTANVE